MTDLRVFPSYDPEKECPKCGAGTARVRYHDHRRRCLTSSEELPAWDAPVQEHLHRACTVCSFDWIEACLARSMINILTGEITLLNAIRQEVVNAPE